MCFIQLNIYNMEKVTFKEVVEKTYDNKIYYQVKDTKDRQGSAFEKFEVGKEYDLDVTSYKAKDGSDRLRFATPKPKGQFTPKNIDGELYNVALIAIQKNIKAEELRDFVRILKQL